MDTEEKFLHYLSRGRDYTNSMDQSPREADVMELGYPLPFMQPIDLSHPPTQFLEDPFKR
jgi:hypothetical protein